MRSVEIFGVPVAAATMDEAVAAIVDDARLGARSTVEFAAVNNVVTARTSPAFGAALRTFDYVFADGAPLAWIARRRSGRRSAQRVTARDFMWRCCAAAEQARIPIFLYGTTATTLAALLASLRSAYPRLVIAGAEPSVFRPLAPLEDRALVARVNGSGARLLFVALGCPLQERFVAAHKGEFAAVQLCVGSAFPALAREIRVAPRIVQRLGFEWLFRLAQEPRRLWARYLVTNPLFALWLLGAAVERCAAALRRRRERAV
jgi:N-acetylglucosaminyldiphosphoundecaprenol N-acetyl-beta-D-mannosaminyltransferase